MTAREEAASSAMSRAETADFTGSSLRPQLRGIIFMDSHSLLGAPRFHGTAGGCTYGKWPRTREGRDQIGPRQPLRARHTGSNVPLTTGRSKGKPTIFGVDSAWISPTALLSPMLCVYA